MSNPYKSLNDYQFWRRAVSRFEGHRVDPVTNPKFKLDKSQRIATAGSCFAQHISKKIDQIGLSYYVAEAGKDLAPEERRKRNYGVFSARYGNIYTSHQLLQLFEEAFEGRLPIERAWQRSDGRFVDPYRSQIEPDGYATAQEVEDARQDHLGFVKQAFGECDVFVFTLGLTEAWRSKQDGFVFPLAPGVVGGEFDQDKHEFVNFEVDDVRSSLETFLGKLRSVNPKVRVFLTVSPVPLMATYEDRHVAVSTIYSKSVLRVVADLVTRGRDWVDYFPSYEIITGSFSNDQYYADDRREVTPQGVSHAMRCFVENYVSAENKRARPVAEPVSGRLYPQSEVICDEEVVDLASRK